MTDVKLSEHCYVTGYLPSNLPEGQTAPALGLIAHMDTATETSGENVKARIVRNYSGGIISLNEKNGLVLDPAVFPSLKKHIGAFRRSISAPKPSETGAPSNIVDEEFVTETGTRDSQKPPFPEKRSSFHKSAAQEANEASRHAPAQYKRISLNPDRPCTLHESRGCQEVWLDEHCCVMRGGNTLRRSATRHLSIRAPLMRPEHC